MIRSINSTQSDGQCGYCRLLGVKSPNRTGTTDGSKFQTKVVSCVVCFNDDELLTSQEYALFLAAVLSHMLLQLFAMPNHSTFATLPLSTLSFIDFLF